MGNVTEHHHDEGRGKTLEALTFNFADYLLSALMLLVSLGIGIYFGFVKRQKTTTDYLLGGRNMSAFPVAVSLAASFVSAIMILSMPSEVYVYGTQFITSCFMSLPVMFIAAKVYLPVFYELKITSCYEYFGLRFDNRLRLLASLVCVINYIFALPIVMYAPALAINLVANVDIDKATVVVGIICIFYTAIGGLRAVVWSDTVQFILMVVGSIVVIVMGVYLEGGVSNVWRANQETGRIEAFDFEFNMYKRTTFWSMAISLSVGYISAFTMNQMSLQRFMALPSMKDAKKVLLIYIGFIVALKVCLLLTGLVIYARYDGCDPLAAGLIKKGDQIMPYYVMDVAKSVPGLPGIFVASVASAALSTMSSKLNTVCGIIYTDFLANLFPKKFSEENGNLIIKTLVFFVGIVCILLVFWIKKMGSLLQLIISFNATAQGPILGAFTLGMLSKRINAKSTLIGLLTSFTFMCWVLFGNKRAIEMGAIRYDKKPMSVDFCDPSLNITQIPREQPNTDDVLAIHKVSFMWYSFMGFATMVIITWIVSLMTDPPKEDCLKPQYFSPVVRKYLFPDYDPEEGQPLKVFKDNNENTVGQK